MREVLVSKITALKASKTRIYPTTRLPKKYSEIIGRKAKIFEMGPPRFELGSPAPKAGRITRLPYGPSSYEQRF